MPRKKSASNKSQAIRDYLKKHPSAQPWEIFDALLKGGIEISEGMTVKYTPPVSKSQAIRDCLAEHPNAMPNDVAKKLAEQGVTVTAALVSCIKQGMKVRERNEKGNLKRKVSRRTSLTNGHPPMSATKMKQVREWVEANGGIEQARGLLEELSAALDYLAGKEGF